MPTIAQAPSFIPALRANPTALASLARQADRPTAATVATSRSEQSDSVTLSAQALAARDESPAPTRVAQALENPEAADKLGKFPAKFQEAVRNLSDNQFAVLGGTPPSEKDRERFISGKAFGFVSIWGEVHRGVTEARTKHGKISAEEEKGLHGLVDQVADFKPAQRKTLLELLDNIRAK